jgi:hypothetical protein
MSFFISGCAITCPAPAVAPPKFREPGFSDVREVKKNRGVDGGEHMSRIMVVARKPVQ